MLNPKKKTDHLLFSDFLAPPEQYPILECTIATTYSLDISALISCMIPLAFGDDVDSKLFKNKISILSSLESLSKKMVVFCDPGQIKTSRSKNKEFALLLESIVTPVKLPKLNETYPSFHPKMWLLRFSNKKKESHYRLIVLSRNISYDKTYDISLVLESSESDESKNGDFEKTKPVLDYLKYLKTISSMSREKISLIDSLLKRMEKEKVCFTVDDPIFDGRNYDIIPMYHKKGGAETFLERVFHKKIRYNKILIVSPFLKPNFLSFLRKKLIKENKKNIKVITRNSSLEGFNENYFDDFEFFTLNPGVIESTQASFDDSINIDEEEKIEDDLYDIHAKLFLLESSNKKELIIGSANATNAAFSINHELVVRLTSVEKNLCVNNFFNELNTEKKNFFIPVDLAPSSKESSSLQKDVENVIRRMSHITIRGMVSKVNEKYKVVLHFDEIPILKGVNVRIRMLSLNGKDVSLTNMPEDIVFSDVNARDISEFFYIYAEKKDGSDVVKMERIIKIPLEGNPYCERKQLLINEIINDKDSLSEYILLMLSSDPILSQIKKGKGGESNPRSRIPYNQTPLYETLLRACISNPQAVLDLEDEFKLITNKDVVPDDLRYLYSQFKCALANKGPC